MEDTDWITVVNEVEQQLLTAIYTIKELRQDMEFRRSTRLAPEQLVITTSREPVPFRQKRGTAPAPRARRAWTTQETERVVYLWLTNVSLEAIAADVGRSPRSIECHISDLRVQGMALPKRPGGKAFHG